jgi:hypothetical protein
MAFVVVSRTSPPQRLSAVVAFKQSLRAETATTPAMLKSRGNGNKGHCMASELSSTQWCYDNDMTDSAVLPRWSTQEGKETGFRTRQSTTVDQASVSVFVHLHLCSGVH